MDGFSGAKSRSRSMSHERDYPMKQLSKYGSNPLKDKIIIALLPKGGPVRTPARPDITILIDDFFR